MGKLHDSILDEHRRFIEAQRMFFVATAPRAPTGHINLSPKGLDCFRILSPKRVAYLDLTGSGNETSAHLHENGRITLMFCAFEGAALILRIYGRGRTVLPGSADWDEMIIHFPAYPGVRQIIDVEVFQVGTSCGNGVPLYDFVGQRDKMITWAANTGEEQMEAYRQRLNRRSIDGLPTPLERQTELT